MVPHTRFLAPLFVLFSRRLGCCGGLELPARDALVPVAQRVARELPLAGHGPVLRRVAAGDVADVGVHLQRRADSVCREMSRDLSLMLKAAAMWPTGFEGIIGITEAKARTRGVCPV